MEGKPPTPSTSRGSGQHNPIPDGKIICQVAVVKTLKRVLKARKSTEVTDKTVRISEVLVKKRSVTPKVLGGLIEEKITRTCQSIKDKE